jgi:hypothetical protein
MKVVSLETDDGKLCGRIVYFMKFAVQDDRTPRQLNPVLLRGIFSVV